MNLVLRVSILLLLGAAGGLRAFDLQQFMQETQRVSQNSGGVTLAWWIPTAYWDQSLRQNPKVTPAQIAEIIAALEPYTMFAVVKMEVGSLGTIKTKKRSEVLDALDVKFGGRSLDLAQDSELSQEMKNLLMVLRPLMASMLGQMGQGLEFVIYPNVRAGKKIIDPKLEGTIEAKVFDQTFRWRLPLGVLLPAKMDPKSGEVFPGNYSYNPFTGEKLTTKENVEPKSGG